MERWVGKVALVTGASSGIGLYISLALVREGMIVIGGARRSILVKDTAQRLAEELGPDATGKLIPMKLDVSKEDEVLEAFATIKKDYGGVDVCVNAAGLGHMAPLLSGETHLWRDMLEVNVLGVAVVIREAVKSMEEKGSAGHIINMCSLAAHTRILGASILNFYSLTKQAVRSITESVREELREKNSSIRITQLSPGTVASEFFKSLVQRKEAGEEMKKLEGSQQPGQSELASGLEKLSRLADPRVARSVVAMGKASFLLPEDVARCAVQALSQPEHVEVNDVIVRPRDQLV